MEEGNRPIRELLGRGELLGAYDLAADRVAADPTDREARYLGILALARAGATDRALRALEASGLDDGLTAPDRQLGPGLEEDVAALRARIDKDRALRVDGEVRRRHARASAERYEQVHDATGGTFPLVNAATMWLLAGDRDRSSSLARAVLDSERSDDGGDGLASYWSAVTVAESALLLTDVERASAAIVDAAALAAGDLSARASTRRQLRLVCGLVGLPVDVLAPLANPGVVHYCGHRIAAAAGGAGGVGRFEADAEREVARRFAQAFEEFGVGIGYGSLASGADILAAEALLDRGAELHVWLPFDEAEFVDVSVAPAGSGWVDRFERCLDAANSVGMASVGASIGDPVLFDHCARLAMGHAVIRAEHLDADVVQVALWDERPSGETAGTAIDVERWRASGRSTIVLKPPPTSVPPPLDPAGVDRVRRVERAMVFADVAGFSRLADREVDVYDRHVLTALARTIDGFGDAVLLRETWGDGIYLVLADVTAAAACALALQETMASIDLPALGLGALRGLRVGAHVGPVLDGWDPITGRNRISGRHVTTTARVEPRTPEGDVYVTEHFAAIAVLDTAGAVRCQYVGRVPAAKDYGDLPMYLLAGSDPA